VAEWATSTDQRGTGTLPDMPAGWKKVEY